MQIGLTRQELLGLSGRANLRYIPIDQRFNDSGVKNLGINGSVTPVDYSIGPTAGEIWIVSYATLLLIDPGTMTDSVFGSLASPLTNGLQILSTIDTVERQSTNLFDNRDVIQCFNGGIAGQSSPAGNTGFLETEDYSTGRMCLDDMILIGDQGDKLITRVRDDLSTIQFLGLSVHAYQLI